LHWYAKNAFEYARAQEHHGHPGLGIAILLGFTSLVMLVGFFVDIVIQIRKKTDAKFSGGYFYPVSAAHAAWLVRM